MRVQITRSTLALAGLLGLLDLGSVAEAAKAATAPKVTKAAKTEKTVKVAKIGLDAEASVKAYVKEHKLKARTVDIKLPGLNTKRTFVPVLADTQADFLERFGETHGAVTLRYNHDLEHPLVFFGPNRGLTHVPFHWEGKLRKGMARYADPERDKDSWQVKRGEAGRYLVLDLGEKNLRGLEQHWAETKKGNDNNKSGCMWWFVHAQVDKDTPLAHAIGVKRSSAASNFLKKIVHAGNERVPVIGVAVSSLAEFEKMTNQELLGPPPGGGAMEAMKE